MAHGRVTETIPDTAYEVFDLVHAYPRRLEWDSLLLAAYLDDGKTEAARGATSVCVGKFRSEVRKRLRALKGYFERCLDHARNAWPG